MTEQDYFREIKALKDISLSLIRIEIYHMISEKRNDAHKQHMYGLMNMNTYFLNLRKFDGFSKFEEIPLYEYNLQCILKEKLPWNLGQIESHEEYLSNILFRLRGMLKVFTYKEQQLNQYVGDLKAMSNPEIDTNPNHLRCLMSRIWKDLNEVRKNQFHSYLNKLEPDTAYYRKAVDLGLINQNQIPLQDNLVCESIP